MDPDLQRPEFTNENKAREALEAIRWPDGPYCPHCGNSNQDKIAMGQGRIARRGLYYCAECNGQFTVTIGTVMERSKIPLGKWLLAMHLMGASKKRMSALQLQRMLGVTYKTAWFLCHRIREAMTPARRGPLGGKGKTIEADETHIGGKEKNKHVGKEFARHEAVNHSADEDVRGLPHSPFDQRSFLPRCLTEWDFKWSTRKTTDEERVTIIAKGIEGQCLKYRPSH